MYINFLGKVFFIVSFFFLQTPLFGQKSNLHRVISCNIRVALDEDETKGVGWSTRKNVCVKVIKAQHADIICLQEVIGVQNEDMKKVFSSYRVLGYDGPEMDAHKEGYHGIAKNLILFSLKRYEFISAGCYWLSETPIIGGSKSWETARARHVNWVRIKDRSTEKEFRILSTHLDHVSQLAREKQIALIINEAAQYQPAFPQILAGDFNCTQKNQVIEQLIHNGWKDTYREIYGQEEPGFTGHSFLGENYPKKDKAGKIDFIFVKGNVKVTSSHIIKDKIKSTYPSDHYFVSADLIIE